MRTIIFLSDTFNRRHLSVYGNREVHTPNLDRLASRSHIFENHWTGSAPCMPARRDILTGRLGFLERNWGPIEAFDHPLPELLKTRSIRSHMVTDHYHYCELGGEGYYQSFTSWRMFRGQENDNQEWMEASYEKPDHLGRVSEYYQHNRRRFRSEEQFSSPQTYQAGARWLEEHGHEDNYMLWIEGFDPHEPFDVPNSYLEMYEDDYDGTHFEWPEYAPFSGSDEELAHIRKRYMATLTMTDHWIGKVLDVCDRMNLWKDTMIIFTTDHGYMLGEHGLMAKNYMQGYNEIYHIPLMIHQPGQEMENRIQGLTQNIDLFPTICDHFEVPEEDFVNPIHGKSLMPLMNGEVESLRKAVLYGVYGKSVNICDGQYSFFKAPIRDDNSPLNLYTSMPTTLRQYIGHSSIEDKEAIDTGHFLSWTDFPVYKIPASQFRYADSSQNFSGRSEYHDRDYLFDIKADYFQEFELDDPKIIDRLEHLMKDLMEEYDSPEEQLERLGLT